MLLQSKIAFLFIFFLLVLQANAQVVITSLPPDSTAIKEYERRTKLTRIDGKYIPKDLNDALKELDKIMDAEAIAKFKAFTEEDARRKTHFSFGKYLLVRWSLQEGSRLSLWFRNNKIMNHDDMIDCLITTYHRKLNNKPLSFEELAEYYYAKQMEKVNKAVEEKKKRDAKKNK